MNVWNGFEHNKYEQTEQPGQTEASFRIQEQKKARVKQFLKMISEDSSLSNKQACPAVLSEWARLSGTPRATGSIDMAELTTALLKNHGYEACHEEMMDFILRGGTVDEFMRAGKRMAT